MRLFVLFISVLAMSCAKPKTNATTATANSTDAQRPVVRNFREFSKLNLCAAVRGNGQNIMAHFSSLAAITENAGLIDGYLGGSSASISMFLYESMLKNERLWTCQQVQACDELFFRKRISLMLKSTYPFLYRIARTPQALAFGQIGNTVTAARLMQIDTLIKRNDIPNALAAIRTIMTDPTISSLVNDDAMRMLTPSDPRLLPYYVSELAEMLRNTADFKVPNNHLFFRPGLIAFQNLAGHVGSIGNFFAGRFALNNDFGRYLDQCADTAWNKSWTQISRDPAMASCLGQFDRLVSFYMSPGGTGNYNRTVDEAVGGLLPGLVTTAVLNRVDSAWFEHGKQLFMSNKLEDFNTNVFDKILFGYWGQPRELSAMMGNRWQFPDRKTALRFPIGQAPWRHVLALSPAEPGLANLQKIPNTPLMSAGGWSDLHPVLAAKNMGCNKVIYITRETAESPFAMLVARELGMSTQQENLLYNLRTNSSFSLSLQQANAVYCTDWNRFAATDPTALDSDAWLAPTYSRDPYFSQLVQRGRKKSPVPVGCGI